MSFLFSPFHLRPPLCGGYGEFHGKKLGLAELGGSGDGGGGFGAVEVVGMMDLIVREMVLSFSFPLKTPAGWGGSRTRRLKAGQ